MRKYIFYLILSFCFLLSNCNLAYAQGGSQILRAKCPNSSSYQSFQLLSTGSQAVRTCAGGTFSVNGVNISGGGTISGATTANFVPYSSGANTLANSPLGWNGTIYSFNNTALNSQFTLDFTPNLGAGTGFRVGDYTTTPTYYWTLTNSGNTEFSSLDIDLGDLTNSGNGTRLGISDTANLLTFQNTAGTNSLNFDLDTGLFNLDGDYQRDGVTVISSQFGFPLLGTNGQFYIGGTNGTPIFQGRNEFSVTTATFVPITIKGAAAQSGNLISFQTSASASLGGFTNNGAWIPTQLADGDAANNTVYFSTTANKLVYKDGAGIVNVLY